MINKCRCQNQIKKKHLNDDDDNNNNKNDHSDSIEMHQNTKRRKIQPKNKETINRHPNRDYNSTNNDDHNDNDTNKP